ncbi:MAG: LacI family transcriptional regulator [Eubacterium sp.]|nr:LacI family transcriptional regulator [Eubacterium sp.]
MAATVKDIAQRAGCGVATVSSYLNGGNVRPGNREKIRQAISELHYEVNETARQLKTNRTRMIGAVIPELNSTFCASVLSEIEDILRQHGYAMLVCDCRTDSVREREAVDFLLKRRVDGLFVLPVDETGSNLRKFIRTGKPVVLIDRQIEGLDVDTVCVDNRAAIRSAVDLLVQKGHSRIGMIAGPSGINAARQRMRGYIEGCEKNGICQNRDLIFQGDDSIESGTAGIETLIKMHPDMTAVVISNYRMTMGAMIGANESGIMIPQQLSVVGFDNPQFARAVHPRLTIVNQPVDEIGERAAKIMLERLGDVDAPEGSMDGSEDCANPECGHRHIWLTTAILEGGSVLDRS